MNEPDFEFEKAENAILKNVPPEFHGPLSSFAYQKGHGGGEQEVLNYLSELVEMLEEPIREFKGRIYEDGVQDGYNTEWPIQ